MIKKFINQNLFIIIQLVIFLSFIVLTLGMVFSYGICCGDDATHAMIAKNFATGLGYTTTFQENQIFFTQVKFFPRVGVGPVIILPVSALIKLVGNTYWAPGVTQVFLWALLLLLIGYFINQQFQSKAKILLAIITFFTFSYLLFAYHFEHWYALLGEIPASLLIFLAILIFFDKQTKKNEFVSGLIFSLAFNAKFLALISFVIFIYFVFFYKTKVIKKSDDRFKKTIFSIINLSLGFLTPIIILEIWKLISLNFSGYITNWEGLIDFISDKGISQQQDILSKIIERNQLFKNRFGVTFPIILLIFLNGGLLTYKDKRLFTYYLAVVLIILVYTIYWFFFSIGWARYYIIPLLLITITLSLPYLAESINLRFKLSHTSLLIILALLIIQTLDVDYPLRSMTLFTPTQNVLDQKTVTDILSQDDNKPFVTQWWATGADIEYSLNSYQNMTTYLDPKLASKDKFTVIVNTKFLDTSDVRFMNLLDSCDLLILNNYMIGNCENSLLQ